MKNLATRTLVMLSVGMVMAACSAKIETPAAPAIPVVDLDTPNPVDFQSHVAGPNLDGQWRSACIEDYMAAGVWDVVLLKINGQAITRDVSQYSDSTCMSEIQTREEQGQFRYNTVHPNNLFEAEYRFKMPNGYYTQYENFRFDGIQLFISNEIGGAASADNLMYRFDVTNPGPTSAAF